METNKHEALFQPIKIGKVEIKNRIAMAPMCTFHNTHDGYVNDQVLAYFAARAKGGTGLIFTMPIGCNPITAQLTPFYNLCLWDSSHRPGISDMAEVVHYFGAKIFGQLSSFGAGRQGKQLGSRDPSKQIAAPSETEPYHVDESMYPKKMKEHAQKRGWSFFPVPFQDGDRPRAYTIDEIIAMEDHIARGAFFAKICGLDGIEMHFPHGYGGYQFLSPRTNLRNDLYGGNFVNRTRVLRNSLLKARKLCGPDFPIGYRISCSEHMPGGLTIEDTIEICKSSQDWGADFIDLSNGCYEALKYFLPDDPDANIAEAKIIKSALKIPVITPSIHDPDLAEKCIKDGTTDMVALGRQLLADPDWANKAARGEKYTKCIRCNVGCIRRLLMQFPIRCEVNRNCGYERFVPEYRMSEGPPKESWYPTVVGIV